MKKFKNLTLTEYVSVLSSKNPVPGGGSTAALSGALGAGLICMVTEYSLGKSKSQAIENKFKQILKKSKKIQKEFLNLVDRDAQAYLKVVQSRQKSIFEKKRAQEISRRVPFEICQLCYQTIELAPFLVKHGNKNLISDVQAAVELLLASFKAALIFTKET